LDLSEPGDCLALRLKPESAPTLSCRGDPEVRNDALQHGAYLFV
jgi:hypothetical protein